MKITLHGEKLKVNIYGEEQTANMRGLVLYPTIELVIVQLYTKYELFY